MALKVRNFMEVCVEEFMDDVLDKYPGVCTCQACRSDIAAYALNQLPPKYTTTYLGETYSKTSILDYQYRADILKAITQAVQCVKRSPRHNRPEAK